MSKQKKNIGKDVFDSYYRELYGGRWENLKSAFYSEPSYTELFHPRAQKSYFLDSASVMCASCLPLQDADEILDLCAAPGGKTLCLAMLMPENSRLSSNERSPERKHRLSTVVSESLPPEIQERIAVSCSDGAKWCTRQSECFDSILLDAPCSSERHVMLDKKYLDVWTPSRIKAVTSEQWALLSCSFRLLKKGGHLLYSTCALCPDENDGMILRLHKKFKDQFTVENPVPNEKILSFTNINSFPKAEKTEFGFQILPDTADGAGPIYYCLIKKSD